LSRYVGLQFVLGDFVDLGGGPHLETSCNPVTVKLKFQEVGYKQLQIEPNLIQFFSVDFIDLEGIVLMERIHLLLTNYGMSVANQN